MEDMKEVRWAEGGGGVEAATDVKRKWKGVYKKKYIYTKNYKNGGNKNR